VIGRYVGFWFFLLVVAVANGALREEVYRRHVGELTAHQISSLTGVAVFFVVTYLASGQWRIRTAHEASMIGVIWCGMTIAFEFVFGRLVMGRPWGQLFGDYDLLAGRVWVLVLVAIVFLPYAAYRLRAQSLRS
jgi:hypothetical protein